MSHSIPVYAYEGDNADMPLTSAADPTEPQGSYHDWEPGFLFPGNLSMGITTNLDADQAVLASQLIDQFSAFARTGNPTATGTPLRPLLRENPVPSAPSRGNVDPWRAPSVSRR